MRIIDAALIAATRARESLVQQRNSIAIGGRMQHESDNVPAVATKTCVVSFADMRVIRHAVGVNAQSLYEAAVLPPRDGSAKIRALRASVNAVVFDVEVREPSTSCRRSLSTCAASIFGDAGTSRTRFGVSCQPVLLGIWRSDRRAA
jgi:hypothetical protein